MSESPNDGSRSGDQPGGEQRAEPVNERVSDWRGDGSGGRFTEPPKRPPAADPVARPAAKPASGWPSDRPGKSAGDRLGKSSSDPVSDLQRRLMKAGARSMANQVADNVRRSLGQAKRKQDSGDVWGTATTEPPPGEPPECQWCPVCQAARRMRVSGPGLGDRLASAGGVLASVVQEAFSAVEQVMKVPPEDSQRNKAP